jgi:hypothetical protein
VARRAVELKAVLNRQDAKDTKKGNFFLGDLGVLAVHSFFGRGVAFQGAIR